MPSNGALQAISKKRISLTRHHVRALFSFHSERSERGPRRRRIAEDVPSTMSDLTLINAKPPQHPAKPIKRQRVTRISVQLKSAIDAMVWLGMKRDEAAQHAGMKDNSLYVAFRRPDVKAAYLAECEVLRVSGRARRIHRLEAMVEQDDNKAAVINAALALDRMPDEVASGRGANSLPGLQIVIVQGGSAATPPTIDVTHD